MEYTQKLEDAFWIMDYDDVTEEKIMDFFNSSKTFLTFGESLERFISHKIPEDCNKNAYEYLKIKLKEKDLKLNRNTLKNWFETDSRPKMGKQSREHMYIVCFALELSLDETREFFRKVYFDRPFDMRNPRELIFYYCLRNEFTYQHALKLIEKVSIANTINTMDDATVSTQLITDETMTFMKDQELIDYILEHPHNFQLNSITAKEVLKTLLDKVRAKEGDKEKLVERTVDSNCGLVTQELFRFPALLAKNKSLTSISSMLDIIMNIDMVKLREDKGDSVFNNIILPTEIKNCFPTKHTFSKQNPTYEELRKMIILLTFYELYFGIEYLDEETDLETCGMVVDARLMEAGMPCLYYGNPYDWLFLYCTVHNKPLDVFRGIMAEIFFKE